MNNLVSVPWYLNKGSPFIRDFDRDKPNTVRIQPIKAQARGGAWGDDDNPGLPGLDRGGGDVDGWEGDVGGAYVYPSDQRNVHGLLDVVEAEGDERVNRPLDEQVLGEGETRLGDHSGDVCDVGLRRRSVRRGGNREDEEDEKDQRHGRQKGLAKVSLLDNAVWMIYGV